jgi:hypothetical protein
MRVYRRTELLSKQAGSLNVRMSPFRLSKTISTHGYTINVVFMSCEGAQEVSGLHVPQLDGLIITAATGKGLPIQTEGYTPNNALMSSESANTKPGEIFRRYQRFRLYWLLL